MNKFEQYLPIVSGTKELLQRTYNAQLFNLTVSGAHLYGFPSPDSDVDIRGTFLLNTNELLGLKSFRDNIQYMGGTEPKYDIVLNELKKELNLAIKGNCNVLEHLMADQLYTTSEYLELKRLIWNTAHKKGVYDSYKGMATFNYKKFILGGKKTLKKYLYVLRALMCGIHFLETGNIQPNITDVNKLRFSYQLVDKLVEEKKRGQELSIVSDSALRDETEKLVQHLFTEIDRVYTESPLSENTNKEDVEALDSYLKQIRRKVIEDELYDTIHLTTGL